MTTSRSHSSDEILMTVKKALFLLNRKKIQQTKKATQSSGSTKSAGKSEKISNKAPIYLRKMGIRKLMKQIDLLLQ
jgi:hypothetical protein